MSHQNKLWSRLILILHTYRVLYITRSCLCFMSVFHVDFALLACLHNTLAMMLKISFCLNIFLSSHTYNAVFFKAKFKNAIATIYMEKYNKRNKFKAFYFAKKYFLLRIFFYLNTKAILTLSENYIFTLPVLHY